MAESARVWMLAVLETVTLSGGHPDRNKRGRGDVRGGLESSVFCIYLT